jgi:hypothetical protein
MRQREQERERERQRERDAEQEAPDIFGCSPIMPSCMSVVLARSQVWMSSPVTHMHAHTHTHTRKHSLRCVGFSPVQTLLAHHTNPVGDHTRSIPALALHFLFFCH